MEAFAACCMDEEARAALRVNKDIEREIERWKRDNSKEYKLLLLGELLDTPSPLALVKLFMVFKTHNTVPID